MSGDTHPSIHLQTELITFAAGLQPAMRSSNPSNHYTTIKTMMNQHYNNYNSHHYNFCCCTSTTTTSNRSRTNVPVSLEPVARPVTCIPRAASDIASDDRLCLSYSESAAWLTA